MNVTSPTSSMRNSIVLAHVIQTTERLLYAFAPKSLLISIMRKLFQWGFTNNPNGPKANKSSYSLFLCTLCSTLHDNLVTWHLPKTEAKPHISPYSLGILSQTVKPAETWDPSKPLASVGSCSRKFLLSLDLQTATFPTVTHYFYPLHSTFAEGGRLH